MTTNIGHGLQSRASGLLRRPAGNLGLLLLLAAVVIYIAINVSLTF